MTHVTIRSASLTVAVSEWPGRRVELDAAVGRAPRRLRDERRAPARGRRGGSRRARSPRSCRARSGAGGRRRASRSPGRASSTSTVDDAWLAGGLATVLAAGRRSAAARQRRAERIQVELVSANPTGPITVASARNGAYGDAVARLLAFAGHEVEREYYYNDAGAQMDLFRESVEAVRRGEEPPEDGYQGDYVAELARVEGDPVPRMLEQIEAVARAVPDPLRHLRAAERRRGRGARGDRAARHLRGRRRRLGADERPRRRQGPRASSARTASRRTSRSTLPTSGGSTRAGSTGSIYVLGADHHGYVARLQALAEMLGHPRESVEVLDLPARQPDPRRRGGEDVEAARRRRLPRGVPRRDRDRRRALVPPLARTRPDDRDRRRPRRREEPEEPRLLRPVRARADRRHPAERGRGASPDPRPARPLAAEERELVKRLLELPDVVREATARRAPHAIPTYAIRVADDFHRFYHEHKVLGSERGELPARALHGDADRRRDLPRPARDRAPERMYAGARLAPRSRQSRATRGVGLEPGPGGPAEDCFGRHR